MNNWTAIRVISVRYAYATPTISCTNSTGEESTDVVAEPLATETAVSEIEETLTDVVEYPSDVEQAADVNETSDFVGYAYVTVNVDNPVNVQN